MEIKQIDIEKYFNINDIKINKFKLAYINTNELGEALTIFNCKIRVIQHLLEKQNYGEAKEKIKELSTQAFFKKIQSVYRFNQALYYKFKKVEH